MKESFELIKWLLEKDIRARNAVSALSALISIIVFYFAAKDTQWFQELKSYGPVGIGAAMLIVSLSVFLLTSLVCSGVLNWREQRNAIAEAEQKRKQAIDHAEHRRKQTHAMLNSLSDWQRQFVLRFIVERRTQIPDFEVGEYRIASDSEMRVLIDKGVIKEYRRAGVYEIEPQYREYLEENWNPDSGTLS